MKLKRLGLLLALVIAGALVALMAILRHGLSARDKPSAVESIVAKAARSMAVPSRAKHLTNPLSRTPGNLDEAEAHWADHCATCHANNGSGDTVIGANLYPKAPDMRLAETQGKTDGELYYIIENGVRLTGMPAWGRGGDDDQDTWKLVLFIRYLPHLSANEELKMEKMNSKSAEERAEEQEEERFLNTGETLMNANPSQHHHE